MGTQTLGSTSNPGTTHFFFTTNSGDAYKAVDNDLVTPTEMYIDRVNIWCAPRSGSSTLKFAIYGTGGTRLGQTDVNHVFGTSIGWCHGEFSQANYLHLMSSQDIVAAVLSGSGQGLQMAGDGSGGTRKFSRRTGTSFPSPWSGSDESSEGNLFWYLTYFPVATVTSIPSTPQSPGSTISVVGRSFTAGIKTVKVNGLACTGVSVVDDTHLTCVVPSGATSGPVVVDTYAGTATSVGNLLISGARVQQGGSIKSTVAIRSQQGGTLKNVVNVRAAVDDGHGGVTLVEAH